MTRQLERTSVTLRRADRPGDLGWIVQSHGEIYHEQFGWNTDFEALVARIVADFAAAHDPAREAAWIAEVGGARAGSVLCATDTEPDIARLRVLLVTPEARGLGVGTLLVEECLRFARAAGYRRMVLWTNSELVAARRIYQACGFTLVDEQPHHSWGQDHIGQDWAVDLHAH